MHTRRRYDLFAVTAPGLAPITARELRSSLGVEPVAVEPEGVSFTGTMEEIQRANLHLRTASRIVVRLGAFRATSFAELERVAKRLPWGEFLRPGTPVTARVTARKSRLYHSDAVAERIERWAVAGAAGTAGTAGTRDSGPGTRRGRPSPGSRRSATGPDVVAPPSRVPSPRSPLPSPHSPLPQLVIVRLVHDECQVSLDSSGELLHVRGYRQAVAKAPVRETLAAALLLASGWGEEGGGDAPLVDPLCGSGTIAIEGALMARRVAPGLGGATADATMPTRPFAFMDWAGFDPDGWSRIVSEARAAVRPTTPAPIVASDRDAGAIEAARANAERAGVAADIDFRRQPLSAVEPPEGARNGWLATNPPYGVRVGDRGALRNLYAQLGNVARARWPGWTVSLISADRALERQTRLPLRELARTTNGGIPVRLLAATVP